MEGSSAIGSSGAAAAGEVPSAAPGAALEEPPRVGEVVVCFLSGSEVVVPVVAEHTVADVVRAVLAQKEPPPGRRLTLLDGGHEVRLTDSAAALAGRSLTGVFSGHDLGYLVFNDAGDGVALLMPGDDAFDPELAERAANVDPSSWVAPPEGHPECRNLASLDLGASAIASSNIWGTGLAGAEKLKNVLRLGSRYGDPRILGGDTSFIFKERDADQTLVVDLGQPTFLVRVGTMSYKDRWLDRLEIDTSSQEAAPSEWTSWGRAGCSHNGGPVHLDTEAPISARFVRFRCSSGHYYGAGARLGPVFAYGVADPAR